MVLHICSHFDPLKVNLHYGGVMEISGGRVSYIGGALKEGIVVDPDFLTWSCFDGYCEEFSIEGGLVERVWWKLHQESMNTVKCFAFLTSDKEIMGMCSEAMSTSREVDVFIEQKENGKDGAKDCEHSAEEDLEQSAAAETEIEKAPSEHSAEENLEQSAAAETEIEKAPSEHSAEENENEAAEENENEAVEENENEAAADESEKDPGNESEVDSEKEEGLREAKRKKDKKGNSRVLADEDDIGARYEMEIEDAVASFVDEEIDFRREIPESSDSEEEEDDLALRKRRMRRDAQVDKLALGATFWSGYEFKEAVLDYALTNAKNIEQNRWDKTKIGYKCGEGGKCEWRLYCSYDEPQGKWVMVAWAVVQAETGDNWLWFLKNLKADLGLEDGSGYVIISDRCKGLLTSVKAELPNAEHRFCVKHICENLKKNHAGKDLLKKYVWNVAWSCNMSAYRKNLQKLKEYDVPLFEDVLRMEPRNWTLAFFKLGSFCDKVENDSTESFNGTITKARGKAIIPMLETIRRQAMVRNAKRQKKAERWDGRCTKYVKFVLAELKEHADKCVVTRGSHGHFEVDLYDDRCQVDMQKKTCSCFKWQISGIPCEHAYGAMLDAGLDTDDYVYECFSTAKQRDCYSDNVDPMRGPRFWMAGSHRLVVPPPEQDPPEGTEKKKEKKSKKGKKRIKGKFESPKKKKRQVQKTKRTGRIMHCSKCGEVGHNAATCEIHPKKKRKMTDEASDQANASSQGAGHGAFQGPETMSLTQPSQMLE